MNLKVSIFFLLLILIINSCTTQTILEKREKIENVKINQKPISNFPIYIIGEPYFIEGLKYVPEEDYKYKEIGLASYYDKELHGKKTVNNEINKVTELYARHKTLPIPSIAKITNLENGLYLVVRINDRGPQSNTKIIEVSRKVAQLLRFYKTKTAMVKVEILSDQSKQLKIVTQSIDNPEFNTTIEAAPVETVNITDLGETSDEEITNDNEFDQPIELGMESVTNNEVYIQINEFQIFSEVKDLIKTIEKDYKTTTQKKEDHYNIIFGPLQNQEVDNLFQILVSRGYKNVEIIIK